MRTDFLFVCFWVNYPFKTNTLRLNTAMWPHWAHRHTHTKAIPTKTAK